MACDHGMMLMSDHDDAYVDAMLMVNMQANTRSVTALPPYKNLVARCNTPSVSLHVNHEHCINTSIIMLIHKHLS